MYTSFYNLQSKPFQLSPDPRFFFGSSGHKRAMSYLRYGLSQSEGFIVVTGGIGTGKTTLVRNLFSELDDGEVVAAQLVTSQLEADDMLSLVVAAFGVAHEGVSKAVLIKRLEDFLGNCSLQGKRVLLVVDEAQNLPIRSLEELRMLSNFQIADKPLLQSFLLGQDNFRKTLQSPDLEQLRQRIIASCHLSALDQEETRHYLLHRLAVAGWRDDPKFHPDCFAAIHAATGGIPRKINVLCDRLLLYGFLEQLHELGAANVEEVVSELSKELRTVDVPTTPAEPSVEVNDVRHDNLVPTVSVVPPRPAVDEGRDDGRLEEVERRLSELEETVGVLRRGFLQLTRLLNRSRAS